MAAMETRYKNSVKGRVGRGRRRGGVEDVGDGRAPRLRRWWRRGLLTRRRRRGDGVHQRCCGVATPDKVIGRRRRRCRPLSAQPTAMDGEHRSSGKRRGSGQRRDSGQHRDARVFFFCLLLETLRFRSGFHAIGSCFSFVWNRRRIRGRSTWDTEPK